MFSLLLFSPVTAGSQEQPAQNKSRVKQNYLGWRMLLFESVLRCLCPLALPSLQQSQIDSGQLLSQLLLLLHWLPPVHTDLSSQISSQIASLSCLNPHWLPRSNGILSQLHPLPHLPCLSPHEIYSFHLPNLISNIFLHHLHASVMMAPGDSEKRPHPFYFQPLPLLFMLLWRCSPSSMTGSCTSIRLNITSSPTSPEVQWLRLWAFTAGDTDLIPGWRTKIPHATWEGQKKKKKSSPHKPFPWPP